MAYKNNTKRDTVKALLRSDTMSNIIRGALESPVGSTPRKRAQKIVSIMRKMQPQKNDGAGGPGQVSQSYNGPIPIIPGVKKKSVRGSIRVFEAPPPMRTTQEIMDGAGGAGSLSDYGLLGAGISQYKHIPGIVGGAMDISKGLGEFALKNTSQGLTDLYKGAIGKAYPGQGPGYISFGNTSGGQSLTSRLGGTTQPLSVGGTPSPTGGPSSYTVMPGRRLLDAINGVTPTKEGAYPGSMIPSTSTLLGSKTPSGQPSSLSGSGTGSFMGEGMGFGEGDWPTSAGAGSTAWGGLYGNIQNKNLRESIESGMGAGAFALSSMGDINKLRELPGFENVPDDFLPWGANLSGQLNYLRETLDREIGVNKSMDELERSLSSYEDFVNGGVGLQERLTDYVRRRDEFLNQTTGMMEDFKDKLLDGSIDTYNPTVARQAESYLGYLGTLQGRQNKRYTEWVNQSTSVYGQQLQANADILSQKMNVYQLKSNELKERYASGEKIALIEYEQIYNALQGMYQTAAQMPMQQLQFEALQAESYISAAKAAQDQMNGLNGFDKLSDEYQKAYKFVSDNLIDSDTKTFKEGQRNISSILSSFSDGVGDPNKAELIIEVYKNNLGKDFEGVDSDTAAQRAMAHYQGIAEFQYTWAKLIREEGFFTPEQEAEALRRLQDHTKDIARSVTTPFIDSVTNSIKADPNKVEILKNAVESLTNPRRMFGLSKGDIPSKEEFLKRYSGQLSSQLLTLLYATFDQYVKADSDAMASPWIFYAGTQSKDPGIRSISNDEFVNNVMGKIYYSLSQYNPGFM